MAAPSGSGDSMPLAFLLNDKDFSPHETRPFWSQFGVAPRLRSRTIRSQMSQAVQTRRFRVALSFPGEHRERVEKIAEALGEKLGRDRVLYDKW